MIVSTKGRYILRVLIDLAENKSQGLIPMNQVAKRQDISLKYLEKILPILTKHDYIEGVSGKGGGYKLTKDPKQYNVGEILRLTEGNLAPVTCLSNNNENCARKNKCRTILMWSGLNKLINDYLDNYTIADLMHISED